MSQTLGGPLATDALAMAIPGRHNGDGTLIGGYHVYGAHYYYNPLTTQITFLSTSDAVDCNLTQWGLEYR